MSAASGTLGLAFALGPARCSCTLGDRRPLFGTERRCSGVASLETAETSQRDRRGVLLDRMRRSHFRLALCRQISGGGRIGRDRTCRPNMSVPELARLAWHVPKADGFGWAGQGHVPHAMSATFSRGTRERWAERSSRDGRS